MSKTSLSDQAQAAADKATAEAALALANAPKPGEFDDKIAAAQAEGKVAFVTAAGHLRIDN